MVDALALLGGRVEGEMSFWPHYVLIGVGIVFAMVLLLSSVRLALRLLVILGKAAVILFLLLLLGWIVGLWQLPRPVALLLSSVSRLLRPFLETLLQYVRDQLR